MCLLAVAALTGGCGTPSEPDTSRAEAPASPSGEVVTEAVAPLGRPVHATSTAAVGPSTDAELPWGDRVVVERALAERDVRHAPRTDEGGPELGPADGALRATFSSAGARARIGEREVTLRASALGRGDRSAALASGEPVIAGPEVSTVRGGAVREWWRSLPSGLEHGLTVTERPAGDGALVIEVEVGGTLSPYARSSDAIELHDPDGALVATYERVVVVDASGARVPARMAARGTIIVIEVDDASARYPLVIDPLLVATEQATLLNADNGGMDLLGTSVALSADGTRAVVGANQDDTAGGVRAGSARVFLRAGTTWSEEAALLAVGGAVNDRLGHSVSLSADASRALVGAPGDSVTWNYQGTARVFVRTGTTWAEEATLVGSGAYMNDSLGTSVSLTADGSLAFVGAPYDDHAGGTDAGSVRVFVRTGTAWSEQATLVASGGGTDGFGISVSLAADGSRALVGAFRDDTAGGTQAGSARVLVRSGSVWSEEATLLPASGAGANDQFGWSVSLSADGSRALVGANKDDTTSSNAGSAHVFVRSGTVWSAEATILAAGAGANDEFGTSVALSADGSRAIVSAYLDDYGGVPTTDAGTVRVLARTGTVWSEDLLLVASGAEDDHFGNSVSLSADGSLALVGAPWDTTAAGGLAGTGRVFSIRAADPTGTSCSGGSTCLSGFCVDGVCCNTGCGGSSTDCQACSGALTGGASGTCAPLSAAAAPTVTCRFSVGPCDVTDTCVGGSAICPEAVGPASTSCRAADPTMCRAETFCTGASPSCPASPPASAATSCRAATASTCRAETFCAGSATTCPASPPAAGGTVCRAGAAGTCDATEVCNGIATACPIDGPATPGTECRASAGLCDPAEVCDGASFACPGDGRSPANTVCAAASGSCSSPGVCDGSGATCPGASPRPAGTVCSPAMAGNPCDLDDTCDGVTDACAARFASVATTCGPAPSGACDAPDHCAGTSGSCVVTLELAGTECRGATGLCDVAEACTGASPTCPTNDFEPPGTVCRGSLGPCDVDEVCSGSAASCPLDARASTSTACRPSAGPCDRPESCDGFSPGCPADMIALPGAVCRPPSGTCDVAETCGGIDVTCPADVLASSGTTCRVTAGACDVAEACTGASPACPTDDFVLASTICRPTTGGCDPDERCSGASAACPGDARSAAGTVCGGTAVGSCSSRGTCDGIAASCPGATPRPAGTVCLPATPGNPCDIDDTCDGTTDACVALFAVAATSCGAAPSGVCDAPDHCAGTSGNCVATFLSGVECRAASGTCDVAESCGGALPDCPLDVLVTAGSECRSAADACDLAETCSGAAGACPADAFAPTSTLCRSAIGPCDADDLCTGTSATCGNVFAAPGTECRPATGPCDVSDACSGTNVTCPTDAFEVAGTVCAPSGGDICDADDVCAGTSADCVPTFLAGVACRASVGGCDAAEVCGGSSASCPPDQVSPTGTVCRDSIDLSCDPLESCDGTATACPADVTSCAPRDAGGDAAGIDGGGDSRADTGAAGPDAGAPLVAAEGCGCRAAAGPRGPWLELGLVLALVVVTRRRRWRA